MLCRLEVWILPQRLLFLDDSPFVQTAQEDRKSFVDVIHERPFAGRVSERNVWNAELALAGKLKVAVACSARIESNLEVWVSFEADEFKEVIV